jgi:hypothetical protein
MAESMRPFRSKHNHDGDAFLVECTNTMCPAGWHEVAPPREEGCDEGVVQTATGWWYHHLLVSRDGRQCYACKAKPGPPDYHLLEVQHILPQSKGGTNCLHNLILLCQRCHRRLAKGRRYGGIPNVRPSMMPLEEF